MIVAEGAIDMELNPIKAEYVKEVLTTRLGLDTRVTTLGHTQRGGRPCAWDRILVSAARKIQVVLILILLSKPTLQGVEAVSVLLEATPETPSYMIGIKENKITRVPLMEAVEMVSSSVVAPGKVINHSSRRETSHKP